VAKTEAWVDFQLHGRDFSNFRNRYDVIIFPLIGSVWMKFIRQMLNHVEKRHILLQKKFTAPFKDEIRQLADLKHQISQKDDITSQHSAIVAMCCKVISSSVLFAVLDLRVSKCPP